MDKKNYTIVVGSGTTSRANLEALMEDHYYAKGPENILMLVFKDKPSQGQMFASQLAKDKGKHIVVFTTPTASFEGIPSSSISQTSDPIAEVFKDITNPEQYSTFILWNDEDKDCVRTLVRSTEAGVKCYDLTDGLNLLTPSDNVEEQAEPTIPTQETIDEEEPEDDGEDEEEEEDFSDEEDDEDPEDEILENLYFGIQAVAQIFAREFLAAFTDSDKKPSKGDAA